jgi:ferric-dicitrate binding protein FerR (iron transport regulator)
MEKDYTAFSAVDFAQDSDFIKWVKYGHQEHSLDLFWKKFVHEHPGKTDIIKDARQLVSAILLEQNQPGYNKEAEVWDRIVTTLGDATTSVPAQKQRFFWHGWMGKAAAIVLVLAVALFSIWKNKNDSEHATSIADVTNDKPDFTVYENVTPSARTIILPDGTSIVLQPRSSLTYPEVFKKNIREVYLEGEAFFEVKKDPTRPFLVHANEIVTRVLGTSFSVKNFSGDDVLVQVKTGKVTVYKERPSVSRGSSKREIIEGVVLTPNQQAVYERKPMKLTKSLVENPSILVPVAKQEFQFSDTPIKEVFEAIERAYGVDIVYDEEVLSNCFLNASLSDVPLHDKLKLISKGINTTYEMIDSHIIIYGQGCN